jgi:hypothetical protein
MKSVTLTLVLSIAIALLCWRLTRWCNRVLRGEEAAARRRARSLRRGPHGWFET